MGPDRNAFRIQETDDIFRGSRNSFSARRREPKPHDATLSLDEHQQPLEVAEFDPPIVKVNRAVRFHRNRRQDGLVNLSAAHYAEKSDNERRILEKSLHAISPTVTGSHAKAVRTKTRARLAMVNSMGRANCRSGFIPRTIAASSRSHTQTAPPNR